LARNAKGLIGFGLGHEKPLVDDVVPSLHVRSIRRPPVLCVDRRTREKLQERSRSTVDQRVAVWEQVAQSLVRLAQILCQFDQCLSSEHLASRLRADDRQIGAVGFDQSAALLEQPGMRDLSVPRCSDADRERLTLWQPSI